MAMRGIMRQLSDISLKRDIAQLVRLVDEQSKPNINELWMQLKELNAIKYSVKQQGYAIAREVFERLAATEVPKRADPALALNWKPCTQSDIESHWFRFWCDQLHSAPIPHRKLWEYAYILQNLFSAGLLKEGKSGLGFGCGKEPLPSYFAGLGLQTTITDLAPDKVAGMGWAETGQHTSTLEDCYVPDLVTRRLFLDRCELKYVDMNHIPPSLNSRYDFCWSVCALEHLGSIDAGLKFIRNSLDCLRSGGVAIHTTEFNYTNTEPTIDNWSTVLFLRRHFTALHAELGREGFVVAPLDFDVGAMPLDSFVDLPPFDWEMPRNESEPPKHLSGHLKLSVDGFPSTCFGMTIRKP